MRSRFRSFLWRSSLQLPSEKQSKTECRRALERRGDRILSIADSPFSSRTTPATRRRTYRDYDFQAQRGDISIAGADRVSHRDASMVELHRGAVSPCVFA